MWRETLFMTIHTQKKNSKQTNKKNNGYVFGFANVQFGQLKSSARKSSFFWTGRLEVRPWLTACLILKSLELNAASWFECWKWVFRSLVRRGLSWLLSDSNFFYSQNLFMLRKIFITFAINGYCLRNSL